MKISRIILTAIAVVIVGGTIAGATPHLFAGPDKKDSIEPSVSPSPGKSETPGPTDSPSPSETPEPTETPSPEPSDATGGGVSGTQPDFSACAGLNGLGNAICRHEALLQVHPGNQGLQSSLSHLQANLVKHQTRHGTGATSHGKSGEPHGKSGEPHGHSG
jgi:hypothetical protein